MQAYNLDQLPINLNGWMNSRFLKPILNIEGGWEYWMQIDFLAWLDTSTGLQWDFRREVIENNVRLDWAVNTNSWRRGQRSILSARRRNISRTGSCPMSPTTSPS
jgi:hypothetical protein